MNLDSEEMEKLEEYLDAHKYAVSETPTSRNRKNGGAKQWFVQCKKSDDDDQFDVFPKCVTITAESVEDTSLERRMYWRVPIGGSGGEDKMFVWTSGCGTGLNMFVNIINKGQCAWMGNGGSSSKISVGTALSGDYGTCGFVTEKKAKVCVLASAYNSLKTDNLYRLAEPGDPSWVTSVVTG